MLSRVFEPFVQSERTPDRAPGGLGIGLTVAKSLVELHGGQISAESDGPGRGSTFVVRLPAAEPRPPAVEEGPKPAAGAARSARRARILVVDDNRDAADILAEALGELGHEVGVVYDGPSALAVAARLRPEVALLDIGLPAMDGYELARRLRERPGMEGLRLIALTGYGQESDRTRTSAAGFGAHIVKPADLAAIQAALESC